jgi:pimeloyl-ACP methyl ester carboxylesterase
VLSARQIVALGSAALGALVALNGALAIGPRTPTSAMPGEPNEFDWDGGRIWYTVAGAGAPLVLIHSLGVAASSFEYRYVLELLARRRQVFCLDLLGFGNSAHPRIDYRAGLYERLVQTFLAQVVRGPADLLASGAASLFAVAAARAVPEAVSTLILVMPSMPDGRPELPALVRQATASCLRAPVLGQSLFNLMTARNALRSQLRERAYFNPDLVTESMVDAQYAMAHQAEALLAPRAYLAGALGSDVSERLSALRQPMLLVLGEHAKPSPWPCAAEYARRAPQARIAVISNSGTLPHEEQPEYFCKTLLDWLDAS